MIVTIWLENAIYLSFYQYIYFIATLNCYKVVLYCLDFFCCGQILAGSTTRGANQMLAFSQQTQARIAPRKRLSYPLRLSVHPPVSTPATGFKIWGLGMDIDCVDISCWLWHSHYFPS